MADLPKIVPVPGYPGYGASACGRIWSKWIKNAGPIPKQGSEWREVAQCMGTRTYFQVNLHKQDRGKTYPVHKIMMMAFDVPGNGSQCRHLNGDPTDNRLENLCRGTAKENAADRIKHGRQQRMVGETHGCAKLTWEKVRRIRKERSEGITLASLAAKYSISESAVSMIVNNKRWKEREVNRAPGSPN